MQVYESIKSVASKMADDGISKSRKNATQGYQFRGIDDIYGALSRAMVDASLVILPRCVERSVVERASKNGGALFYTVVKVEYDLVCTVDGSKHTAVVYGEAMDSADKSTNKAMSAAYKYMALQTFCIPTEGDNDADGVTHEVAASKPTPKKVTQSELDSFKKMEFSSEVEVKKAGGAIYIRARDAGQEDFMAAVEQIVEQKKEKLNAN